MANRRWLGLGFAAAAAVVIGLLVTLWLQTRAPEPTAVAAAAPKGGLTVPELVRTHELAAISAQAAAVTAPPGKIDPSGDEFFHRFYDLQPAMLTRNAAKCYTGGLSRVHRNSKVKLTFTNRIHNGEVSVEDVAVSGDTTVGDRQLIDCFVREIKATRWHDDSLPDWSGPDELVLRPERGMKKFADENVKDE